MSSHSKVHLMHFHQPVMSLLYALKLNSTFSYSYLVKKMKAEKKIENNCENCIDLHPKVSEFI